MQEVFFEKVYGPEERAEIERVVRIDAPLQSSAEIASHPELLSDVELIFTGWGGPTIDDAFLAAAPNLRAVFCASGSVAGTVGTEAVWERGIHVVSAYAANAVPVAEFTLAAILFSLKNAWRFALQMRATEEWIPCSVEEFDVPGCFGSTVGLVSMGMIARHVVKLLRNFDLRIQVYDPFLSAGDAAKLDIKRVALEELFRTSDVVSIHTPLIRETEGMIGKGLIASMKGGATLINTSRGAVVREEEMLDAAALRPDLQFVLDVVHPTPPAAGSRLFTLPNVLVTPHIAGSMGVECRRMGRMMVAELHRYLAGEPLQWAVTRDLAAFSTHRPAFMQTDPIQTTMKGSKTMLACGASGL